MSQESEEVVNVLAAFVLAAKHGHITIDEAVSRAYRAGELAGRIRGLHDARQIVAGEKS